MHLGRTTLPERVLAEEEHEASPVLVHRAPVTLHQPRTLDDIGQLDLLVACKLRESDFRQLLVDCGRDLLREYLVVLIFAEAAIQVRSISLLRYASRLTLEEKYQQLALPAVERMVSPRRYRTHSYPAQDSRPETPLRCNTSKSCGEQQGFAVQEHFFLTRCSGLETGDGKPGAAR